MRLAPVNNGFFPFDFARDISDILRKQWAGMLYDFLTQRQSTSQLATATTLLKNISIAGEKVEELVKSIYRHIDTTGADKQIDFVEKRAIARSFYDESLRHFNREMLKGNLVELLTSTPMIGNWYQYIADATNGTVSTERFDDGKGSSKRYVIIDWGGFGTFADCPEDANDESSEKSRKQQERFEVIKGISKSELNQILLEFDWLR